MNRMLSLILALIYSIFSFFGIPYDMPDLRPTPLPEIILTKEERKTLETFFETETAWIASLQLNNGALPMTYNPNAELTVNPYFSSYAALALLDNADKYADVVKKYLDWHFAHLNTSETDYAGVDGTIYDYKVKVTNGVVTGERMSERKYDSSDAYAAVFLTLLNKYYNKTSDAEYIISKRNEISRVVNAMIATMHKGLAFACPDYKIKFLMDNSEVYEGAVNGAELFEKVICPADASYKRTLNICKDTAEQVSKAIERDMWKADLGYYQTALTEKGTNASNFSWKSFYPSATSQLFAISCDVIPAGSERAKSLYSNFCNHHDWEHLKFNSEFCWGSVVIAAGKMHDKDRVLTYVESYNEKFGNHAYPLYNGDAGRVVLGVNIILENAK